LRHAGATAASIVSALTPATAAAAAARAVGLLLAVRESEVLGAMRRRPSAAVIIL
jgi:hypothetical protein